MSLTKNDLIEAVRKKSGLNRNRSVELVDHLLETMKNALEADEDVLITGFGKFRVNEKDSRIGRNPFNGEEMVLDGRKVVTFKCSTKLKERLNKKGKKKKPRIRNS